MPALCWFYALTPDEYRSLTLIDRDELVVFMHERLKATQGRR